MPQAANNPAPRPRQPQGGNGSNPGGSLRERFEQRLRAESGREAPAQDQPIQRTRPDQLKPRNRPRPDEGRGDGTRETRGRADGEQGARRKPEDTDTEGALDEGAEEVTEEREADEAEGTEETTEEAADSEEEGEPDEDADPRDAELEALRKADKARRADYTRKTQRLAAAMQQVQQDHSTVRTTAEALKQVFEMPLRQFDAVDWASLQTQDPAKYQQARAQYEQVVNGVRGLQKAIADNQQQQAEHEERARRHRAAASYDALTTLIDGYGKEVYTATRKFAIETLGYTAEEYDANVDHRIVYAAHLAMRGAQSDVVPTVRRRKPGKAPETMGRNRAPVGRDSAGRFAADARQEWQQNAGKRGFAARAFQRRLEAERKRNAR